MIWSCWLRLPWTSLLIGPKLPDLSLAVTINPTTRQLYRFVKSFELLFAPSILIASQLTWALPLFHLLLFFSRDHPVNFCTNNPIFSLVLPTNSDNYPEFKTTHKAIMPPAKKESKEKNTHKLALKGVLQSISISLIGNWPYQGSSKTVTEFVSLPIQSTNTWKLTWAQFEYCINTIL
jgi:hypothetical protein